MGLILACDHQTTSATDSVHFEFTVEVVSDAALCAGTAKDLENYTARVFEFFSEIVPEELRVPIQVMMDVPCSEGINACYRSNTVFIASDGMGGLFGNILRHEVAHALVDQIWGQSIPFFNEGLAEAVSGSIYSVTQHNPSKPVGSMLDQSREGVDYTAAARFTRFLIDSRGLPQFKRLFQATQERSQDKIRAQFAEIYDESFEAIEADFLSKPRNCLYLLGVCDPLLAEPTGERWTTQFAASCADPDFYGINVHGRSFIAAQRTVVLEYAGRYALRTSAEVILDLSQIPQVSQIRITRCGECDEQYVWLIQGSENEVELSAGMYTFTFAPAGDSVIEIDLEYLGS